MEFKKSNRYSNGRTRLTVPERSDPTSISIAHVGKTASKNWEMKRTIQLQPSKALVIIGIVVVFVIVAVVGIVIVAHSIPSKSPTTSNGIITNPGYSTVLPTGKTITGLGGWERISPPGSEPVYAYADKIGDVSVSVSEQQLPETFKSDTDTKVADFAKRYNATKKIIAGDTTAYLGTSVKGPQSTIFTKKNLLVLIKSQENVKDAAWINYIKSLN